jgi:hypothetical protein
MKPLNSSRSLGVIVSYPKYDVVNKADEPVLFTGSGRVGKIVATAAAKTLTPTTLEVGHPFRPSAIRSPNI